MLDNITKFLKENTGTVVGAATGSAIVLISTGSFFISVASFCISCFAAHIATNTKK